MTTETTIGTSGGNKPLTEVHVGTSGGNKKAWAVWAGTSGGNKLVHAKGHSISGANWTDITGGSTSTNIVTIAGLDAGVTVNLLVLWDTAGDVGEVDYKKNGGAATAIPIGVSTPIPVTNTDTIQFLAATGDTMLGNINVSNEDTGENIDDIDIVILIE